MKLVPVALVAAIAATPTLAATIGLGGTPRANQGIESGRSGVTHERFNTIGSPTTCGQQTGNAAYDFTDGNGPSASGSFAYVSGRVLNRNEPPGRNATVETVVNTSCYLVVTRFQSDDFAPLTINSGGAPVQYLGFYWGSIDEYNRIELFDGAGDEIAIDGIADPAGISGTAVANLLGVALYTSQYVELRFGALEDFRQIVFSTSNRAFELDNLAFSEAAQPATLVADDVTNPITVPAPATALLFGLGLVTLARRARR